MSYLNQCRCEELYEPEHVYVFTGPCRITGKDHTVTLPAARLFQYNQGACVQDAFPNLSPGDREFIISGTSPEGWKQMFGDKDEIEETEAPETAPHN